MTQPKVYTFVLSDESVNSYGFRVITEGIDLTLFEKNPIALWVHARSSRWGDYERLPIGKWVNIRKKGTKLLADLEFDMDDDFAVKLQKKVEKKIINMASAGLRIVATSEDKTVLVKGQTRPTVIKSLLVEASLVDIGSNRNALRLQDEFGEEINLSDHGSNHLLPILNLQENQINHENQNENMDFQKLVAQAVNLADNASQTDILAAVQKAVQDSVTLADVQGQVTTLSDEKKTLNDQLKVYQDAEEETEKQKRIDLVDQAIADKKITASEKEAYLELAEGNFEQTKKILDAMNGTKELGEGHEDEVELSAFDKRFEEINKKLKK